jgi:hypothetical protein
VGKEIGQPRDHGALLGLHDQLDALRKKESHAALSASLFLAGVVLVVLGVVRASVTLEVNGFLLAVAGLVAGSVEISRQRKIRGLERSIAMIEGRGSDQGREDGSPGRP